jgi:hypothetical protein
VSVLPAESSDIETWGRSARVSITDSLEHFATFALPSSPRRLSQCYALRAMLDED